METEKRNKNLFVGVGLIMVGVVFLLERLGIYSDFIHHYLFRWESLLILIGALLILIRRKFVSGIITMGVGFYFLMDDLYFAFHNWEIWFIPVALILAGLAYIIDPGSKIRTKEHNRKH